MIGTIFRLTPLFLPAGLLWLLLSGPIMEASRMALAQVACFWVLFVFDSSARKRRFFAAFFAAVIFKLSYLGNVDFNYTPFLVVSSGLFLWLLGSYFTSKIYARIAGSVGLLFTFSSFLIYLKIFELKYELFIFFSIWMIFLLLPLLFERQRIDDRPMWFPVILHQTIVRLFFLAWISSFSHEIASLGLFDEISLLLVSVSSFVIFFGFLNWKSTRWEYLYESFLTLLTGYCAFAGGDRLIEVGVVLSIVHFIIGFEKNEKKELSSAEYINYSTQNGGFGGTTFWISLVLILNLAESTRGFEVLVWLVALFALSWASWVQPRMRINGAIKNSEMTKLRLVFQSIASLIFLGLFAGGVL